MNRLNKYLNDPELQRTLKRLAWISGIFVVLILIVSAIERKSTNEIGDLDIDIEPLPGGYYLIDTSDVRDLIRRSFGFDLEGQKQHLVNVDRLERVMEDDPFVLDSEVYINHKSEVAIKLWQREPVLRIMDNNGLNYYLDKEGIKLPLSKHFTARVLVATGNLPPHSPDFLTKKKRHLLRDAFQLAHLIRSQEFYKSLIEQIHIVNGEFILIPKVGDQKIKFGPFKDAETKLKNLQTFYEEGMAYEGWTKYREIDVRFKGQVVTKKR